MEKRILLLLFIILIEWSPVSSQPKNVIFIDFGAFLSPTSATWGIGLNYERMLNNNVSIRLGINLINEQTTYNTNLRLGIPFSAQFFTSADNRLEGGIGTGAAFNIKGYVDHDVFPGLVLRAGYRYQKRDGEGKFIKVGLEFPANLYLSLAGLGYSK